MRPSIKDAMWKFAAPQAWVSRGLEALCRAGRRCGGGGPHAGRIAATPNRAPIPDALAPIPDGAHAVGRAARRDRGLGAATAAVTFSKTIRTVSCGSKDRQ